MPAPAAAAPQSAAVKGTSRSCRLPRATVTSKPCAAIADDQRLGASEMADAEKVLDIEQDALAHPGSSEMLSFWTVTLPS